VIGAFLDECTVKLAAASVKAGALYAALKDWCAENGHKAPNNKDFAAEITARGFDKTKRSHGYVYQGIGLRAEGEDWGQQ